MTIYVFDIDGTICSNTFGEYEKLNQLKQELRLLTNYMIPETLLFFKQHEVWAQIRIIL